MTALVVTVFLASLFGSMHCAGMCGAFVTLSSVDAPGRRGLLLTQAAYHSGRLVTYMALGAVAGGVGAALDLTGSVLFDMQRCALVLAGAFVAGFGIVAGLRILGVRVPRVGVPPPLRALALRGHTWAAGLSPSRRALTIGLMSTLLPCGWLYAFAVSAARSGSPTRGALLMGAFWLGTVPALAAVAATARAAAGPLRRHAPALASLAMVIVGVAAIAGRFNVPALAAETAPPRGDLGAVAADVESLDHELLPCCAPFPP